MMYGTRVDSMERWAPNVLTCLHVVHEDTNAHRVVEITTNSSCIEVSSQCPPSSRDCLQTVLIILAAFGLGVVIILALLGGSLATKRVKFSTNLQLSPSHIWSHVVDRLCQLGSQELLTN